MCWAGEDGPPLTYVDVTSRDVLGLRTSDPLAREQHTFDIPKITPCVALLLGKTFV